MNSYIHYIKGSEAMLDKFQDCTIEQHGHYLFYKNDQGREVGFVRMFDMGELQNEPILAQGNQGKTIQGGHEFEK